MTNPTNARHPIRDVEEEAREFLVWALSGDKPDAEDIVYIAPTVDTSDALRAIVAALSRPDIDKAIADEREAAAGLEPLLRECLEAFKKLTAFAKAYHGIDDLELKIAAAIRARGGHDGT